MVAPRNFVSMVLSSITSAPKLQEISFIFSEKVLDRDVDAVMSLTGWGPVDHQLRRLARQATGNVTASFDFLTGPGWVPRRDDAGIFIRRFRTVGVMRLRSFGEDVAVYHPIAG